MRWQHYLREFHPNRGALYGIPGQVTILLQLFCHTYDYRQFSLIPLLLILFITFLRGPASKVRVGLINLLSPGDAMQERNVAERIKYPDYKFSVRYHDIALLKLDHPLELNPRVRPACLETNVQIPGKSAIASGFGKTSYGQHPPNVLF